MKKLNFPVKIFSIIILTGLFSSGLFSVTVQAAELITFSNGNVADANDVNHNFQELASRINNSTSTPGLKGDKGDKGDPGATVSASRSKLSLLNNLISHSESESTYPYAILDAQSCPSKSAITATAVIDGKVNISIIHLLGHEAISDLFEFSLIGQSLSDIEPATLVGASATLNINTALGNRSINGIVTKIAKTYTESATPVYAVNIEPAMAQLKHTNNYQIYQQMNRSDIIQNLMQSAGFNMDISLQNPGKLFDMSVMYNQSPFSYLQRLTEEGGIAYFFNGGNVIFTDDSSSYQDSGVSLSFIGHDIDISSLNTESQSYAFRYFSAQQSSATQFSTAGYNFQLSTSAILNSQGSGQAEKYTFSFLHTSQNDATNASTLSAARDNARKNRHFGSSNNPLMQAGYRFNLTADNTGKNGALAGSYVTTEITHALTRSSTGSCLVYANNFSSLPDTMIFKPALKTPKAIAPGVTTAVVVGPPGETKYTDAYGRIKVQFHWDRQGSNDENASAWVRVALPVDRINDKLLYVPLVGTEVLVSFLNGDPSLPVITGSLYNDQHLPPLQLPTNRFVNGGSTVTDFPQ